MGRAIRHDNLCIHIFSLTQPRVSGLLIKPDSRKLGLSTHSHIQQISSKCQLCSHAWFPRTFHAEGAVKRDDQPAFAASVLPGEEQKALG